MCVLHNLSYRLDAEVPTRYRQLEYNTRNTYTEKSSTGCFSNKSNKMMVSGAWAPRPPHTAPGPGPASPSSPPRSLLPSGAGQRVSLQTEGPVGRDSRSSDPKPPGLAESGHTSQDTERLSVLGHQPRAPRRVPRPFLQWLQ